MSTREDQVVERFEIWIDLCVYRPEHLFHAKKESYDDDFERMTGFLNI